MQRRDFIKLSALGLVPSYLFAGNFDVDSFLGKIKNQKQDEKNAIEQEKNIEISESLTGDERFLWLVRGNEYFKEVYFANGKYSLDSYKRFCWLMRDQRDENGYVAIDAGLMNLLHKVQNTLISLNGAREPIKINSGYRSPKTNAAIEGAAKNSFHMKGKAVDITLAATDTTLIGTLGVMMQRGGVGFYPNKNFIHLDTGNVRTWTIGNDGVMKSS